MPRSWFNVSSCEAYRLGRRAPSALTVAKWAKSGRSSKSSAIRGLTLVIWVIESSTINS
jgi:hypothetical protein